MEGVEKPKRKRKRTGCLSCRARRVKCDERKPTCERCENANIDCAGYETRRQVTERPKAQPGAQKRPRNGTGRMPRNSPETGQFLLEEQSKGATAIEACLQHTFETISPVHHARTSSNQALSFQRPQTIIPVPIDVRDDGAPLTALLSNPDSFQRPCADARGVLAYHQFVFRTLPLLFPPEHVDFWRDTFCHEAWGCDHIYLTLTALGSMHRAALLLPMLDENDRNRGHDIKVIAFQTYTRALESLSGHLDEAKTRPDLLVAVLELLAYFECFTGNLPAAAGHIQTAFYYHARIGTQSTDRAQSEHTRRSVRPENLAAIDSCLQDLCRIRRITLPVFRPSIDLKRPASMANKDGASNIAYAVSHGSGMPFSTTLQSTLDSVVQDLGHEALMWNTCIACEKSPPADDILRLKQHLEDWRTRYMRYLPQELAHSSSTTLQDFRNELQADVLAMPPLPYTNPADSAGCLVVAALYNFYMGRTMWALALLEREESNADEASAYFYFYQSLRFAATQLAGVYHNSADNTSRPQSTERYVPSEALKPGLLPMLHVIAQCSPRQTWIRAIIDMIRQIGYEGLICGEPLAISLIFLQAFETCSGVLQSTQDYPPPAERVIMVLIPETNGRSFVCYYARPVLSEQETTGQGHPRAYEPIGHGRWSIGCDEKAKPEVKVYGADYVNRRFTSHWLLEKPVSLEWLPWSGDAEFDLCRALRNHIDGSRLLSHNGT